MKLSAYFRLSELVCSETAQRMGIDNRPPLRLIRNLRRLALGLDRVRRIVRRPLHVSSGYRSPALNREVGGSPRSRHQAGLAADFVCPAFGRPFRICSTIRRAGLRFEQMIHEFGDAPDGGWVHLGFSHRNRRRTLTIQTNAARFVPGIRPCLRK
jgi:zinc D-Ala-D-Ala carboxypeptidase